jgi:hypothetical protein
MCNQRFQVVRLAGRAGRATIRLIAIRTTIRTINRLFKKLFRLFKKLFQLFKKLFRFRRQIFRPRCRYFGFLFRYFGFRFTYFGFRFTYFGFRFTYFGFRFTYFGFWAPNRVACNNKQYRTDLDDLKTVCVTGMALPFWIYWWIGQVSLPIKQNKTSKEMMVY